MAHRTRRSGFSFLEVLLVLGIVGLMLLCIVGFFISRHSEPLKEPVAAVAPASPPPRPTAPAPAAPAPVAPAP